LTTRVQRSIARRARQALPQPVKNVIRPIIGRLTGARP
jgi:hypothetical protein